MEKFKKDFPDEHAAIEARFKSVDREINARVHEAVQKMYQRVQQYVQPAIEGFSSTALRDHVAAIHAAHPDFDTVVEHLPAWIKKQPAYLQPAYQAVFDAGSAQDVNDMVAAYKASIGPAPASGAPTPTPARPKDVDDLTPVRGKRVDTSPKGTPDPGDYDGAWAEVAARAQK